MGHVPKRPCASLISDVYIQEGTRMLAVSRCWVSNHVTIASKPRPRLLMKLAGPGHGRTIPLPDLSQAEILHCGEP